MLSLCSPHFARNLGECVFPLKTEFFISLVYALFVCEYFIFQEKPLKTKEAEDIKVGVLQCYSNRKKYVSYFILF